MTSHPIASVAFRTIQTIGTKLDLVRTLCETAAPSHAAHLRDVLIPKIRKQAKERNRVAHSMWSIPSDLPNAAVLSVKGAPFSYTGQDMQAIAERITSLTDDVWSFAVAIHEERVAALAIDEESLAQESEQSLGEGQE